MNFEQEIIDSMRNQSKVNIHIPNRDELLLYLHGLMLTTGQIKAMYCNSFLDEAVQLLINSVFLYEDGYFDCAFYSIRQSSEVINNMLYLANNEKSELNKWSAKKSFLTDGKLKKELERLSQNYNEVKILIPDYFDHHDKLRNKANKIVHKQGFDTFYRLRSLSINKVDFSQDEELDFFVELLKYSIGLALILFIILEPISLALADETLSQKLNFNLLTEQIDTTYFDRFLGLHNIIPQICKTKFYQDLVAELSEKETMLPSVYSVVREEAWDIDKLNEIETQLHLLNSYERFMFCILKGEIKVSHFYYNGGLSWYFTSIKSNNERNHYGGEEFESYLVPQNRFNQPCGNIFMSVIVMYDEPLYMEHNEPLSNDEIYILNALEEMGIQELEKVNTQISSLAKDIDNS